MTVSSLPDSCSISRSSQRDQTFKDIGLEQQLAIGRCVPFSSRDVTNRALIAAPRLHSHFGPLHQHPTQGYPKDVGCSEMQVIYSDPQACVE